MRYERAIVALLALGVVILAASSFSISRWTPVTRPFLELFGAVLEAFQYPLFAALAVLAMIGLLRWLRHPS